MAAEERTSKAGSRCRLHPGSHTVAACDVCRRALCLACAIPVRGQTLGAECLATILGPDARVPELAYPEPGAAARRVARWAFGLAVLSTLLPWSRVGVGSGAFGGWTDPPRWATVAAVAALVGLVLSVAQRLLGSLAPAWGAALAGTAALVVVGTALALWRPPDFSGTWLGPVVALPAGLAACAASLTVVRRDRDRVRI